MKNENLNDEHGERLIPVWTTVPSSIDERVGLEAKATFTSKSDYWRKCILKVFNQEFGE